MKKRIFSILFALVLVLTLGLVTVVPVAAQDSVPDRLTAITTTADRLVDLQSTTDYGWDWIVTELSAHSANPSAYNMYGVVILGLLDAYGETGTASYLAAATGMANHMTQGTASNGDFYKQGGEQERAGAYDYQFLMRYAEVSDDPTYSDYAIALWEWNKATTPIFASPEALNDELLGWAGSDPGAASWMLAAFGTAIHAMGDDTFATGCADLIVADLAEDGEGWLIGDHMALAESLEFLSELDPATYSDTIDDIITDLVEAQQADGCWNDGSAGTFQDTAYAVRALAVYGGTDGLNAARKGAAWLIADQLENGGWLDDSGGSPIEYSEQDAEGLRALVATAAPVTIAENGYYTIQQAIDSATEGQTILVAAGEYAGAVVDKDVTVSGAPGGASVITSGVPYKVGKTNLHSAFRPDVAGAEIRNFTINCDIENDLDLGVYAVGVDGVTVDFLTINNGTIQGITNWGGSGWVITNNVITDTVAIGGGGIGIFLGAKAQQQCAGNLVQFNTIDATATAETYSCAGIAITLDTRYGGYADLDETEDVSGNQILDNVIVSAGTENSVGIEVGTILGDSEGDPDRTNPELIDALMAEAAVHDNTVQDNSIDGAETGIYFYNVTGLTVAQNEIANSVDKGIYAEHAHSGTVIQANDFADNAIQVLDDAQLLDIQGVLDTNTFDRAVVVDRTGASLLHTIWSSIQDGIDAALSGDTISVAAGTYDETVTLNKALTLQGPNVGISPNTGSRVAEAVITGVSPLVELETGADVNPLTIEGFTFQNATDGGGHAGVIRADGDSEGWGNVTILSNRFIDNYGPAIGVWATNGSVNPADWEITDNLIDGVTGPSKSGIYLDLDYSGLGSGVLVVGFSGWGISNNTIKHTAYGGIMVDDAVDMVISGNTIEDVQKTGIQSSGVSQNVTITDNVITRANLAYAENPRAGIRLYGIDPPDVYAAGTLVGPVWVTNNIVTDSYIGFEIKDGHDITGKVVHVNGNSFTGNSEAGLGHGGTGLLDATNNWWGHAIESQIAKLVSGNVDYSPWLDAADGKSTSLDVTTISLASGWNLISLPLIPDDSAIETVLAGVTVNKVAYYTGGPEGSWLYYTGDLATSDLTQMQDGKGYWIDASTAGALTVRGYELCAPPPAVPPSYNLVEGWNLISFKSLATNTDVATYLGTAVTDAIEAMYGYDAAAGLYTIIKSTDTLVPGDGYWLAVSAEGTIYP